MNTCTKCKKINYKVNWKIYKIVEKHKCQPKTKGKDNLSQKQGTIIVF